MELDFDWNLYRTFYTVAKHKSFSEASKELYVSQPTISNTIKRLEEQLNTKLFYRKTDGVSLTSDGKEFLSYVEKSYNFLVSGTRNLQNSKDFSKGKISIGVRSHIGNLFLFDYIKKFNKKNPNININIISRNTKQTIELLENNEIDFMIDTSPIDSIYNNLTIIPLYELEHCFITKENIKNEISLLELKDYKLIIPLQTSNPGKLLENSFDNLDIKLNPFMTIDTTEMLIKAVKENLGIGYVLKQSVYKELENEELYEIKVKETLPKLMLNIVYIEDYITYIPRTFMKKIINDYS